MAETLQFDLVSPERRLVSVEASQVQIPGIAGDFTALPNHAPFLTTLRPGIVRVHAGGSVDEYIVLGGFAEISPGSASVLAERAVPRGEATAELLTEFEGEAERALGEVPDDTRQVAEQRLRDVRVLRRNLSL
jgi:F-type H+-transporting ATPase subunit epsilon